MTWLGRAGYDAKGIETLRRQHLDEVVRRAVVAAIDTTEPGMPVNVGRVEAALRERWADGGSSRYDRVVAVKATLLHRAGVSPMAANTMAMKYPNALITANVAMLRRDRRTPLDVLSGGLVRRTVERNEAAYDPWAAVKKAELSAKRELAAKADAAAKRTRDAAANAEDERLTRELRERFARTTPSTLRAAIEEVTASLPIRLRERHLPQSDAELVAAASLRSIRDDVATCLDRIESGDRRVVST